MRSYPFSPWLVDITPPSGPSWWDELPPTLRVCNCAGCGALMTATNVRHPGLPEVACRVDDRPWCRPCMDARPRPRRSIGPNYPDWPLRFGVPTVIAHRGRRVIRSPRLDDDNPWQDKVGREREDAG